MSSLILKSPFVMHAYRIFKLSDGKMETVVSHGDAKDAQIKNSLNEYDEFHDRTQFGGSKISETLRAKHLQKDSFIFWCAVNKNYPNESAQDFFMRGYEKIVHQPPTKWKSIFSQHFQDYQFGRTIDRVGFEVETLKNKLTQTREKLEERATHIEKTIEKTEVVKKDAKTFEKKSRSLNRCCCG